MVSRAGRVVVMDFGLAKSIADMPAPTIAGTLGYMAPEHTRGDAVDARADVFAAGVVLAEMLAVGKGGDVEARRAVWRAVRETPPRPPDSPWASVLARAVAPDRDARFASARALARALEEVTLRHPGLEDRHPYPGLAAFSERDAEYFFGRELEVEAVWKKLKRPRMLGLIGPSGAGKSSFLRAGLLPTLPSTWRAVLATPGTRPFQALAEALVPEFAGDTEALQSLVRFDDLDTAVAVAARWRKAHEHALVIVDQFEELFTQNPPEIQAAFARLLARFVLDADLHVVVSMRDDFLAHCHAHDALSPILSDLTLLGPLGADGLRRALVQPALACGYQFEDEPLVDDMVQEVAQEKGALPLLAFAASRLWDYRDRERGLLTREPTASIGGVGGALAQHAEATLERIGTAHMPQVRELFRNLVTAQGTRAVRERGELLSVFDRNAGLGDRADAEVILRALVDARLLTSYDRPDADGAPRQEVEIIHESLLSAWPRLVRWQTQDADGAQIRDQLRQAAQVWHDRGRSGELLWSGTAYRELAVWKERYPGGLSATEQAFTEAAARKAGQKRRRQQLMAAAALTVVLAVALSTSLLWRRSERSRQQAESEARRAEAGKLVAMAERELERYPTASLAYTIKSLEVSDTEAARLLALRILQREPVARLATVPTELMGGFDLAFDAAATRFAVGGMLRVGVFDRQGGSPKVLGDYGPPGGRTIGVGFAPGRDVLVTNRQGDLRAWSLPDGRELGRAHQDDSDSRLAFDGQRLFTFATSGPLVTIHAWPLPLGSPSLVGTIDPEPQRVALSAGVVAHARDGNVFVRSLGEWTATPRVVATSDRIQLLAVSPDGTRVATSDGSGDTRIWSVASTTHEPDRVVHAPDAVVDLGLHDRGRWLSTYHFDRGYPVVRLFDLTAPPEAEPLVLRKGDTSVSGTSALDPQAHWAVTAHGREVAFWPLEGLRPRVLRLPRIGLTALALHTGRWALAGAWRRSRDPRTVRPGAGGLSNRVREPSAYPGPAATGDRSDPADHGRGGRRRTGGDRSAGWRRWTRPGRLSAPIRRSDVRRSARTVDCLPQACGRERPPRSACASGTSRPAPPVGTARFPAPAMCWRAESSAWRSSRKTVCWPRSSGTGLVEIDLASGSTRILVTASFRDFALAPDRRSGVGTLLRPDDALAQEASRVVRFNLTDGATVALERYGADVSQIALDPSGTVMATASVDGTIRVGPVSGEEPHLLLGQEGGIYSLAFSPDGRWLAAGGEASVVHLWPVPDRSRPPLHRQPHDALLALLRSHTNLRAVASPDSPGGYLLRPDAFPGWATLPER